MISPAPRGRAPFEDSGVERDGAGVAHYTGLPPSLAEMLRASVESDGDGTAVAEVGGPSLTYGELWERAARVAGGMAQGGVQRGDRVAIRLANGIDWVLAFFGAQLAGAVAVPVNTRLTEEEAAYIVGDSESKLTLGPETALPDGPPMAIEGLTGSDLAAIFYTSGTTGFPKGAMTSQENFLTNSENCLRSLDLDRAEGPRLSTLVSVPLFHVTGCNSQLIPLLHVGGRVEILTNPLDIDGFFEAVGVNGITHLVSVPAIYNLVIRHPRFAELDVSGVRSVTYGGAPIAESLVRDLERAFPGARLGNGFGLTETSSLATFLPFEDAAAHADSVGFAMPVVDLAIAEPDGESGVGELLIRGANVVQGYWRKPEETAEAFADGWLHSGDLARIDAEGLVYVVDRKKDMINRGGENVYSLEVENVLAREPGVGEVAVLAVPDEVMGEKVGAVLVPVAGEKLDVERIVADSRRSLADFKVPQYVAVRDEPLPRNPNGKVLKRRLREETSWGQPLR
ncbi:MAG: AMP-binding protein [Acidobacteriota bacterium]|nr:AMP-binding protein [Acidobacteriota bacterium]